VARSPLHPRPRAGPGPSLWLAMSIRRVVPNLLCSSIPDTRRFYVEVLGFEVVMDMGWIVTLASPDNPTAQVSLSEGEPGAATDHPVLTVEVGEVDEVNAAAVRGRHVIVLSLRDEEWGVRRFFVRDPDRRVINVMAQPGLLP
jgi:catechol 2,3-dioxygenase-like lactoylglutathione lyase family enzyme